MCIRDRAEAAAGATRLPAHRVRRLSWSCSPSSSCEAAVSGIHLIASAIFPPTRALRHGFASPCNRKATTPARIQRGWSTARRVCLYHYRRLSARGPVPGVSTSSTGPASPTPQHQTEPTTTRLKAAARLINQGSELHPGPTIGPPRNTTARSRPAGRARRIQDSNVIVAT